MSCVRRNRICLRGACSVGVAGEKERVVGRGWVREAAARGDIMMGTTAQLEHSFERLYLRAHHGRHASARMSEKSGAGRRRAAADSAARRDFAHRERRGEIVTVGRGAEPAADNNNQNSVAA